VGLFGSRVTLEEGAGIDEPHFAWHATKVKKCIFKAIEPRCLMLIPRSFNVEPSRKTQSGNEQVDPRRLSSDRQSAFHQINDEHTPRGDAERRPDPFPWAVTLWRKKDAASRRGRTPTCELVADRRENHDCDSHGQ